MNRKKLTKEEKFELMKSRPCPCKVKTPPGKKCMYRAYTNSELKQHEKSHKTAIAINKYTPARWYEKDIENKNSSENTVKSEVHLVIEPTCQLDTEASADPYENYEYLEESNSLEIFTNDETVTSNEYDEDNEKKYGISEILSDGENLSFQKEANENKSDEILMVATLVATRAAIHDNEHNAEIEANFHVAKEIVVESNVKDKTKYENNMENASIDDDNVRDEFCFDQMTILANVFAFL